MKRPAKAKKAKAAPAPIQQDLSVPRLPAEIEIDDLAYCSNLTSRWLRELSREGRLPAYPGAKFPLVAVLQALFRYYQTDDAELKAEKLEQAKEKTKKDKRDNLEADGQLIDKTEAERKRIGTARRYHSLVRDAMERKSTAERLQWLAMLNVPIEVRREFGRLDIKHAQAVISKIELWCHRETKEGLSGEGI